MRNLLDNSNMWYLDLLLYTVGSILGSVITQFVYNIIMAHKQKKAAANIPPRRPIGFNANYE